MRINLTLAPLLIVLACGASAQKPPDLFIPEYDYRIVKLVDTDGSATFSVRRVSYWPNTNRKDVFEVSMAPASITGKTKGEVKRELLLFAEAAKRAALEP